MNAADRSIAENQPAKNATIQEWIDWLLGEFLPAWIEKARDPNGLGFYDVLDVNAEAKEANTRTILAQARLLFTFSHLALHQNNPVFKEAAKVARDALPAFRNEKGGYCRAVSSNAVASKGQHDTRVFSYDQSFVILALATWEQLQPSTDESAELEACWLYIKNNLTDPATGLLLEHDKLNNPEDADAPPRAQNPHMHLYEAALQAFEMTGNPVWLERSKDMRSKGLEYFYDTNTGTIKEFIAPDLSSLPGHDGLRREIGHQCEWAWLLCREAQLSDDPQTKHIAQQLLKFADSHGHAKQGLMKGAAFDAVAADRQFTEQSYLLWPQTEAIKTFAIRSSQLEHEQSAKDLMRLVFQQYFHGYPAFINQVDNTGEPIWSDALSRLLYHLVLAITEGARASIWSTALPAAQQHP